jgi:hypothetical protein
VYTAKKSASSLPHHHHTLPEAGFFNNPHFDDGDDDVVREERPLSLFSSACSAESGAAAYPHHCSLEQFTAAAEGDAEVASGAVVTSVLSYPHHIPTTATAAATTVISSLVPAGRAAVGRAVTTPPEVAVAALASVREPGRRPSCNLQNNPFHIKKQILLII